jgi:malate synthase
MSTPLIVPGVEITVPIEDRHAGVLTPEALELVARLHRRFDEIRRGLLEARVRRQDLVRRGATFDFLAETQDVREGDWTIESVPDDLADRRVEITVPTDRKMLINALNSGARTIMADFEDSLSPTWENVVGGQANVIDALEGSIEHTEPDGREYRVEAESPPPLVVRPRGWHLLDRHVLVDGKPVSASLLDFGLFFHHNAQRLVDAGSGPYVYLPKLESYKEARLWNEVFRLAQEAVDLDPGTIKATVLIETLPAAFQMEEILHELRDHVVGLNAGRWDYIFSVIRCFPDRPEFILPDRTKVTMTVPFMRAYTELLVATCHRRGAHAMGGMAALVPSRKDPEGNERALAVVAEDKQREAADGFDGTWVAHPDAVQTALEQFDEVLGDAPNQVERQRDDVEVCAGDLLDVASAGGAGEVTEEGLRSDVNVGIQYISSWLRGKGAAAIYGLMEDAATAEIARSQVWQWRRHGVALPDGTPVEDEVVRRLESEELERIREEIGNDEWFQAEGRPDASRELFEQVALADDFVEFLTIPAYERLD